MVGAAALFIVKLSLAATGAAPAEGGSVAGIIQIAPGAKKMKLADTAALYVIARAGGQKGGPPLAVKRLTPPFNFPVSFSLSQADVMMPDVQFAGDVSLTARISQSGAATPVNPGDIETSAPVATKVGASAKARLLLDKAR
jgi:hypothetical protein